MPTTGGDLINRCLRNIGFISVNSVASDPQAQAALQCVNEMIAMWNRQNLMLFRTVRQTVTITANTGDYTIGTGGTITSIPRPDIIQGASYLVGSGTTQLERPVRVLENISQWQGYPLKNQTGTYPLILYYDPAFPLGTISWRPIPTGSLTGVLYVWGRLTALDLTTAISLPDGYLQCLHLNMVVALGNEFNMPVDQDRRNDAKDAIMWIKNLNAPPRPIMPDFAACGSQVGAGYNIASDDFSGKPVRVS